MSYCMFYLIFKKQIIYCKSVKLSVGLLTYNFEALILKKKNSSK